MLRFSQENRTVWKKSTTVLATKSNMKSNKNISGETHERGHHVFLSVWLQKTFGKADTSDVSSPELLLLRNHQKQ